MMKREEINKSNSKLFIYLFQKICEVSQSRMSQGKIIVMLIILVIFFGLISNLLKIKVYDEKRRN